MISVQTLFQRVNTDLVLKGLGGFANNQVFNRSVNDAQNILFEYYAEKFRMSQKVADALRPFIEYADILISSGSFAFPSDYRHLLDVSYKLSTNTGGEPTTEYHQMREKAQNETRNAFRKPMAGKPKTYAYELSSDGNFVYPSSLTGSVRVKYLRTPVSANRAVVVNATTDDEDYTTTGTVNLEWPEQELTNFIDLLMYFKGVEIRESDLISWVSGKKQFQEAKNR